MDEELTTWQMTTPRGAAVTFTVRNGTSDGSLAYSTMGGPMGYVPIDEYGLRERHLTGGRSTSGRTSAASPSRSPSTTPSSASSRSSACRRTATSSGATSRRTASPTASSSSRRRPAGGPDEISRTCWYGFGDHPAADPGYAPAQRYIGNTFYENVKSGEMTGESVQMPVVSLSDLLETYGIDDVRFLKIDAEGAEWAFLDTPAVERIAEMIGEYHGDYAGQAADAVRTSPTTGPTGPIGDGQAEMRRLLERTHAVTFDTPFPTTGLFRAVRR